MRFLSVILSMADSPAKLAMYAGTSGNTQGEKKDNTPARKARL